MNSLTKKDFETKIEKLQGDPIKITYEMNLVTIKDKRDRVIAEWSQSEFPGCCGLAIAHNLNTDDDLSPIVVELMLQIAKDNGYSGLVIADESGGCFDLGIDPDKDKEWKFNELVNSRTGNEIFLGYHYIEQPEYEDDYYDDSEDIDYL